MVKNNLCFYDDNGKDMAGATFQLIGSEDSELWHLATMML